MSDSFVLLVVVPAIVASVVLLFGFAGCHFEHGILLDSPVIFQAVGMSETTIKVEWTYDKDTNAFEIERSHTGEDTISIVHMRESPLYFPVGPTAFEDAGPLRAGTTYTYRVRVLNRDDEEWSGWSAAVDGTTLIQTFPPSGQSTDLPNDSAGWGHTSLVQRIEASQLAHSGTDVKITLVGPQVGEVAISGMSISQPDPQKPDPYDSAGDLTRILPPAGAFTASGRAFVGVDYTLDNSKPLLIVFDFDSSPVSIPYRNVAPQDATGYRAVAGDSYRLDRQPGYVGQNRVYLIQKIEVKPSV